MWQQDRIPRANGKRRWVLGLVPSPFQRLTQRFLSAGSFGPYDGLILAAPLDQSGIQFDLDLVSSHSARRPPWARWGTLQSGVARSDLWIEKTDCDSRRRQERVDDVECIMDDDDAAGGEAADPSSGYQRTVTTYVIGRLQPSFFGVQRLFSEAVFLSDDVVNLPFSSISPKTDADANDGSRVYKVSALDDASPVLPSLILVHDRRCFLPSPSTPAFYRRFSEAVPRSWLSKTGRQPTPITARQSRWICPPSVCSLAPTMKD